jgi:hypothetical protein
MKAEGQNQQHTQSYTQQPQQSTNSNYLGYINELQHKIRDLEQ